MFMSNSLSTATNIVIVRPSTVMSLKIQIGDNVQMVIITIDILVISYVNELILVYL
jgi:hypothetical protein